MAAEQLTKALLWIVILALISYSTAYAKDRLNVQLTGVSTTFQKDIRNILTLEQYPDYTLSSNLRTYALTRIV